MVDVQINPEPDGEDIKNEVSDPIVESELVPTEWGSVFYFQVNTNPGYENEPRNGPYETFDDCQAAAENFCDSTGLESPEYTIEKVYRRISVG